MVISILLFCSCTTKEKACSGTLSPAPYNQVSDEVHSISMRYHDGDIEFPVNFMKYKEFRNLLENPCVYKHSLIKVIQDDSLTLIHKSIALYALQHLCIDDYIEVIDKVFSQYQANKVDDDFLMAAIDQSGFSHELFKNYDNKPLNNLLVKIKEVRLNKGKDVEFLNNIISGKVWQGIQDYDGSEFKPWVCQ